jgi:organic radical activating enzyme
MISKTFCSAPWLHTYLGPEYKRNLCCISDFNFTGVKLEDTWNSEEMKEVRRKFISGEEVSACSRCPVGTQNTYRDYWNEKFSDYVGDAITNTEKDGTYHGYPISIDYRTNICNFKCKTCNEVFSSSIHQEQVKLGKIEHNTKNTQNREETITNELDFFIDKHEIVDMYWAGGEPIYYKQHWNTLNRLIENGKSSKIELRYSTNLSSLSSGENKLLELLPNFKSSEFYCSLDGTNEIGEWVRTNLNYNNWKRNFNDLVNYRNSNENRTTIYIVSTLTLPTLIDLPNINRLSNEFDVTLLLQDFVGGNNLLSLTSYPKDIMVDIMDDVISKIKIDGGKNVDYLTKRLEDIKTLNYKNNVTLKDKIDLLEMEKNRFHDKINFIDIVGQYDSIKNFYLGI